MWAAGGACGKSCAAAAQHASSACVMPAANIFAMQPNQVLCQLTGCLPPFPTVERAEEALSWTSVAILFIFVVELVVKLAVFGPSYFLGSWVQLLDASEAGWCRVGCCEYPGTARQGLQGGLCFCGWVIIISVWRMPGQAVTTNPAVATSTRDLHSCAHGRPAPPAAAVVVASLTLELALKGVASEAVGSGRLLCVVLCPSCHCCVWLQAGCSETGLQLVGNAAAS